MDEKVLKISDNCKIDFYKVIKIQKKMFKIYLSNISIWIQL